MSLPGTAFRVVERVRTLLHELLRPGDWVIDATAGNGHDTVFMAQRVEPTGRVWAIDIQPSAIESTRSRLPEDWNHLVTVIPGDHSQIRQLLPEIPDATVRAIVFNLGYLPGSDHQLVTQTTTTLEALQQSLTLLEEGGKILVVAYRGHPEGAAEATAIRLWSRRLLKGYQVQTEISNPEDPRSPILFQIIRGAEREAIVAD